MLALVTNFYRQSTFQTKWFLALLTFLTLLALIISILIYVITPSDITLIQTAVLTLASILFLRFFYTQSLNLNQTIEAYKTQLDGFEESLEAAVLARTQELQRTNEMLLRDLHIDNTTAIMNKRAFLAKLREAILRFNEDHVPFCIIRFDIDHFQHVNHKYGIQTGDEILAKIAKMTTSSCRLVDVVARVAGDEFAILMHHTTYDEAYVLAEMIRKKIEWAVFLDDHHVTASFGIVEVTSKQDEFTLLHHGVLAVQRAKHHGRNTIARLEKEDLLLPQG